MLERTFEGSISRAFKLKKDIDESQLSRLVKSLESKNPSKKYFSSPDRNGDMFIVEKELSAEVDYLKLISKIESALKRIDDGTYGKASDQTTDIP